MIPDSVPDRMCVRASHEVLYPFRFVHGGGGQPPQPGPDNGYSSWIERSDGSIFVVDYTNYGDAPRKAHLVGTEITLADLA
jgi:hypothetical protein